MEIVWRWCERRDSFDGDFIGKVRLGIVWGFHLPNNFHIISTLLKVSLKVLSPYHLHICCILSRQNISPV